MSLPPNRNMPVVNVENRGASVSVGVGMKSPLTKPLNIPKPNLAPSVSSVSNKKFTVKQNDPENLGRKLVIYGPAKVGKSTLASLAPNPVFFNLNKGLIGLRVQTVDGIGSFEDLRAALRQGVELVPEGGTLVIDSLSEVGEFIEEHLKKLHGKDSIAKLGFDKFPCSVEEFRLILSDLDPVVASKRSVLFLSHEATVTYKNAEGSDYRQLGPDISHATNNSCRDTLVKWADHVVRVSLAEAQVSVQTDIKGKPMPGKVLNKTTDRYINTDGTNSVIAGSRRIFFNGAYHRLPGLIAFSGPDDNSFWAALDNPTIFEEQK